MFVFKSASSGSDQSVVGLMEMDQHVTYKHDSEELKHKLAEVYILRIFFNPIRPGGLRYLLYVFFGLNNIFRDWLTFSIYVLGQVKKRLEHSSCIC